MPESPGMTRWILVSLGGFSYLPEDSEDIPFGISGLAPSFIYIPLISPSLIVWYGNCSTESQLISIAISSVAQRRCRVVQEEQGVAEKVEVGRVAKGVHVVKVVGG